MTETIAPTAQSWTVAGRDGGALTFEGVLLGSGSSQRDRKVRWFEVAIYRRKDAKRYVVHTLGVSTVEGERTLGRIVLTSSAYEIVEVLTVIHKGKQYLPRASALALAQAAQWDDDIRDAYVNRAVT